MCQHVEARLSFFFILLLFLFPSQGRGTRRVSIKYRVIKVARKRISLTHSLAFRTGVSVCAVGIMHIKK